MNVTADLHMDAAAISRWPTMARHAVAGWVLFAVLAAGWFLAIDDQRAAWQTAVAKETALKQTYMARIGKLARMSEVRRELDALQDGPDRWLRRLPDRADMPALLDAISRAATSAGVQAQLFQPLPAKRESFYVTQPIKVRMTGTFAQFDTFFGHMMALPHAVIVNVDITSLQLAKKREADTTLLVLKGVITACHRSAGKGTVDQPQVAGVRG